MSRAAPASHPALVGTVTVQPEHLWRLLAQIADHQPAWAALCDGRRHAIAECGVTIDPDRWTELVVAVETLHRLLQPPDDRPPEAGMLGFDFHLTQAGPKLIEINTNPGGLLLGLLQARGLAALHPGLRPAGLPPEEAEMAAARAFLARYRRIAIVDDHPARQFLYPEFLLYQRLFTRLGAEAAIVDGMALTAECLAEFDAVYNRLTDFALTDPNHAVLAQAWQGGRLALVPDGRAYAAYADKRQLVRLCGLPQAGRWLPPTFLAMADNWDGLWQARRHYFFKPAVGYGAKGAYRGDKISRATWDGLNPADYVAQEIVRPPQLESGMKVDIRLFAVDGTVIAGLARLYRGQTTNFRTQGGGLAGLFIAG